MEQFSINESNFVYLSFNFFLIILNKPCSVCNEKYDDAEFLVFVNEKILIENDLSNFGYFNCLKCYTPTHKRCGTSREEKSNFKCQSCIDKVNFYFVLFCV